MTARNLPAIKRIHQTRYIASDGRSFDSHVEAFRHETELQLAGFIFAHRHASAGELAKLLLAANDFRIVLLGPQTSRKEPA